MKNSIRPAPSRSRRSRRRGFTGTIAASLIIAAAAAGCGSSGPATSSSPTPGGHTTSSPQTSSPRLPTSEQLSSALLTASDLGPGYSATTDTSSDTTPSGCSALDALNASASPKPGKIEQDAEFVNGDTGPFVFESLITEPLATLKSDDAAARAALASCKELTIPSAGLTLSLTPISFGGADSTAARMDGEIEGTQVNGYLAFERLGTTELVFTFFQLGSGSSQLASTYYTDAVQKAEKVLGPLAAEPSAS